MKKPPLRRRLGLKALQIAESLLGRRLGRSEEADSAGPIIGPAALDAISQIPTVFACVNRKALDMARVPLHVGRRAGQGGELKPFPDSHELARLFASINPKEGPASYWARVHAMKNLTGDAFIQLERLKGKRIEELWLLPSDRVTVVKAPSRMPAGYRFDDPATGQERTFEPDEIIHTRLPNPANEWRGLAPLMSAQIAAWTEHYLGRNQVDVFQRGGIPPGWLSFKEYVDAKDRDELRKEIARQTAGRESKRLGVLWGDADFIPGAMTPAEGEYSLLKQAVREIICAAFGVPPLFVMNLEHASYANALQQKELYWNNTLIPELDLLAQDLTERLRVLYGDDGLAVWFDLEAVGAIQDLRLVRAQALSELYKGGLITRNEARVEMGRPKATASDYFLDPQSFDIGGILPSPKAPTKRLVRSKAWAQAPERREKSIAAERDMAEHAVQTEREILALEARLERAVLAAGEKGWRVFTEHNPVSGDKAGDVEGIDWNELEAETEATLARVYARVVGSRGQAALDGVLGEDAAGEVFDLTVAGVADWIETAVGERGKLIVGTLRDQLKAEAAASLEAGETSTEFSTRIRDLFELRRSEANRIAWTETGTAYNYGTLEGFRQSEVVTLKEWLTAGDDLVRPAHQDADEQKVELDALFLVDGELLEFPGAPSGTAGNVINCRCTMQPVVDQAAKAARARRKRLPVVSEKELDELLRPGPAVVVYRNGANGAAPVPVRLDISR